MDLPGVSIASTTDSSLFTLSSIKKQKVNVTHSFPLHQTEDKNTAVV